MDAACKTLNLDQIYVLNVRSFKKRRKHIEQELERFGLKAVFIHEWDIADLNENVLERYFLNEDLRWAQKSIAMKHVAALERIIQNKYGAALVLEDDVVLSKNFCNGVNAAMRERPCYPKENVIFIGSGGNFYTPKSRREVGKSLYINKKGRFADSYIIGEKTAQMRLNWIKKNKISKPIDNQFELIDNVLNILILWLEEPVVEQGSKNGLFSTALEPGLPNFLQKLKFSWEKFRRKYIYQLWR